eukprot:COSAG06_NODE_12625_length_1352_cov_2.824421_2_plen_90_part_00
MDGAECILQYLEFTRLLSLSGVGALRVGEARLREGKVRRLQQTTSRLSRARSYVLLSIILSSHRRWDARPPHSLAVASGGGPCVTGSEA